MAWSGTRLFVVGALALTTLPAASATPSMAATSRPSVLLIVSDDQPSEMFTRRLGYLALSCLSWLKLPAKGWLYTSATPLTEDGKWTVEPASTEPYATRILVHRPRDDRAGAGAQHCGHRDVLLPQRGRVAGEDALAAGLQASGKRDRRESQERRQQDVRAHAPMLPRIAADGSLDSLLPGRAATLEA